MMMMMIADRVSKKGYVIGRVRPSVRPPVCFHSIF